jgi:hypothetical protein
MSEEAEGTETAAKSCDQTTCVSNEDTRHQQLHIMSCRNYFDVYVAESFLVFKNGLSYTGNGKSFSGLSAAAGSLSPEIMIIICDSCRFLFMVSSLVKFFAHAKR